MKKMIVCALMLIFVGSGSAQQFILKPEPVVEGKQKEYNLLMINKRQTADQKSEVDVIETSQKINKEQIVMQKAQMASEIVQMQNRIADLQKNIELLTRIINEIEK